MAPVTVRPVSSRSRPLLRRALRHNIIVVITTVMPPVASIFGVGVGRHVPCHVYPKEVISHHSKNNTTKSRSIGTSGLGHPSILININPTTKSGT